jgi:hypothetical protein
MAVFILATGSMPFRYTMFHPNIML